MTDFGNKELYVKELSSHLYLMDEAHESTGYVVVGEDRACVIDTMMGYNDIKAAVRKITDKPLTVVNTHGHPDHIYGNVYFDEAYIHPDDIPAAKEHMQNSVFVEWCNFRGIKMPPFKRICGGDVINLGGKTLKVYDLPGHSKGGILLLLEEDRILFTGDSINHHLWMQLPGSIPLPDFLKELDKVMFLAKEADLILHGHARDYDDISLMGCIRRGVEEICSGHTEGDTPYQWFGGTAFQHPFSVIPGRHYQQDDHVICYNRPV